jgi:hypothetical protein
MPKLSYFNCFISQALVMEPGYQKPVSGGTVHQEHTEQLRALRGQLVSMDKRTRGVEFKHINIAFAMIFCVTKIHSVDTSHYTT